MRLSDGKMQLSLMKCENGSTFEALESARGACARRIWRRVDSGSVEGGGQARFAGSATAMSLVLSNPTILQFKLKRAIGERGPSGIDCGG